MKLRSTAIILSLLALAPAVERSSPQVSGAFFALSVADLKASSKWYSETLGLTVSREIPEAKVAILEGDGLIVELIQQEGAAARPATPTRGLMKAGFIAKDYETTLARLQSAKADIAYGPYPAQGGQRANVIIRDNEGNLLQLFGN